MAKTQDLDQIRALLESDRVWAAFALADLAPEHRPYCEWHIADNEQALILIYRGFDPPLFFAIGEDDQVLALFHDIADEPALYVSVPGELLRKLTDAGYRAEGEQTLYRMILRSGAVPTLDPRTEPLGPDDYQSIERLFADGAATGESPRFFQKSSLDHGVYFGIRENGAIVAAAGTHVYAPKQSVSCLGNVYTRRDCRGRGLASLATGAVAAELLRQGIRTIALNVATANHAAIRVYERLGFARYCEYREATVGRAFVPAAGF